METRTLVRPVCAISAAPAGGLSSSAWLVWLEFQLASLSAPKVSHTIYPRAGCELFEELYRHARESGHGEVRREKPTCRGRGLPEMGRTESGKMAIEEGYRLTNTSVHNDPTQIRTNHDH